MKKSISLLLALVMLVTTFSGFSINVFAEDELVCSWQSGSTQADYDNGVLTISGTGDMADYTVKEPAPWTANDKYPVKSVIINSGVTSIGTRAFSNMYYLVDVEIPDTVTTIGERAFSGSRFIEKLDIPASVTSIGNAAFRTASATMGSELTAINVADANECFSSENGVMYDKEKTILYYVPCSADLTNLVIPDSVETIKDQAGISCINLEKITVGKGVKTIGASAFANAKSLTDVYFYSENTTIGVSAFSASNALTLHGYTTSTAVTYANQNSINFERFPLVTFKSLSGVMDAREYPVGTKAKEIIVPSNSPVAAYNSGMHIEYVWSPEIADVTEDVTYTEAEHIVDCTPVSDEIIDIIPATISADGEITASSTCEVCGETLPVKNAIIPKIEEISLNAYSFVYNGDEVAPVVTVKDREGNVLKYNTDYTIIYSDDMVNVGIHELSVKFIGNYDGTETVVFAITPKPSAMCTAKLSATSYVYTGKDIGPGVSVTDNTGRKLTYKKDYILVYDKGRTNAGRYSVRVNYQGNYSGTETLYFNITPKPSSQCTAKPSAWSYYYTGKDIGPGVTVTDNTGRKLIYKTDYTLVYDKGRTNVGRYSIKVNYKGNYSGTQTIYFYIIPKNVNIQTLTPYSKGFITQWYTHPKEITGYQIQYSQNSNFSAAGMVTVNNPNTNKVWRSYMGANKRYYVRVRTYKYVTIDGKTTTLYSGWSPVKSVVTGK